MFRKHISFFNAPRLWKKISESWWKNNQAWQNCIVRVQKDVLTETIWKKLLIFIFQFFWTFSEIFHHRRRNCIPLVQRIFSMELFLKKKCFIKKNCVWGQNFSDFLRKIFDGVVKNAFYVSRRTSLTTNLIRKHCSFSNTPRLWTKTFGKLVKKKSPSLAKLPCKCPEGRIEGKHNEKKTSSFSIFSSDFGKKF